MKELAISAAALAGLLGFAAFLNTGNNVQTRSKRGIIVDDEIMVGEDDQGDLFASVTSLNNMTEAQAQKIWAELTGVDDVSMKVRAKIPRQQTANYHAQMNTAFDDRTTVGVNAVATIPDRNGDCNSKNTFTLKDDCDCDDNPEQCINYHSGSANHPKVDAILNANLGDGARQASGSDVFNKDRGHAAFYYVVPRAIPLSTNDANNHINDYKNYMAGFLKWKAHFQNDMTVSYGVWQTGVTAAPKNMKFKGVLPEARMKKFWENPGPLTVQPMMARSMNLFRGQLLGRGNHNSANNVGGGRNCYVLWFHQDVPRDLNAFLSGSAEDHGMGGGATQYEASQRCTWAHAFVLPPRNGRSTADMKNLAGKMGAALMGNNKVAIDEKYNGVFYLSSFADVNHNDFINRVLNYFYVAKTRNLCRLQGDLLPDQVVADTGADTDLMEGTAATIEESVADYYDGNANPTQSSNYDYATAAPDNGEDAPTPEVINGCCGAQFNAAAYDNTQKRCCSKGAWGLDNNVVANDESCPT